MTMDRPDFDEVEKKVAALTASWAGERAARMARQALDPADFAALAGAGFTLTGAPEDVGGLWRGQTGAARAESARRTGRLLAMLAGVDPSLALVAAMHPTVLMSWINGPATGGPEGWAQQRAFVFDAVLKGCWFGTISSEPGTGGDFHAVRASAKPGRDGNWRMSGDKYMGSGSGVTSFMMTVARPDGEDQPDLFLLDARDLAWDGSQGLTMTRAWDGAGMAATQSHAFRFDNVPVIRHALRNVIAEMTPKNAPVAAYLFVSVFIGILEAARLEAERQLAPRAERLGPFERSAWVRAMNGVWLARQAFDGMERALVEDETAAHAALHGKLAIAGLAETAMEAFGQAIGGASLSRANPFAQWMQDVRALGHLRPPRALIHARLFEDAAAM